MTDPAQNGSRAYDDRRAQDGIAAPASVLAPELEARIAAFENAAPASGFGAAGWFWMVLLGAIIPLALLIAGWWV
jgi:hypothetical protein